MATSKDAGIGDGGNYIKADAILDEGRVFEIVSAEFRAEHPTPNGIIIKDQVEFTIRFLYTDDTELYRFGLGYNPVRQRFVDWFAAHPDEPLNGVDQERGYVMFEGTAKSGNNAPKLFRDATDKEIERAEQADELPF